MGERERERKEGKKERERKRKKERERKRRRTAVLITVVAGRGAHSIPSNTPDASNNATTLRHCIYIFDQDIVGHSREIEGHVRWQGHGVFNPWLIVRSSSVQDSYLKNVLTLSR